MTMRVQMLRTVYGTGGASGSLLESGQTYTVARSFGAELVGRGDATDVDKVLTVDPKAGQLDLVRLPSGGRALATADGTLFGLSELAAVQTLTATGTALTGAGEYAGFTVRAISGTPQTVTVYDATSATGTPIHTESVTATGYYPWAGSSRRLLATGCHVVISGGTSRTIDVLVGA